MAIYEGSRYQNCKIYKLNDKYHLFDREPLVKKEFDDNITHVITEGERLDTIAYKYWGSPDLFYIICDWNDIYNPLESKLEPGATLILPSYKRVIGEEL